MVMGPSSEVGPHPFGGEKTITSQEASVKTSKATASACIIELLRRQKPETFSDMSELANRHMVRGDDDTDKRHTTTWWCPAEDCRVTATVVFDPSEDDQRVLSYECPSQIPAFPGNCHESAGRTINSEQSEQD